MRKVIRRNEYIRSRLVSFLRRLISSCSACLGAVEGSRVKNGESRSWGSDVTDGNRLDRLRFGATQNNIRVIMSCPVRIKDGK